jgi:hypothetical protein
MGSPMTSDALCMTAICKTTQLTLVAVSIIAALLIEIIENMLMLHFDTSATGANTTPKEEARQK